jgi:hypothetical protein
LIYLLVVQLLDNATDLLFMLDIALNFFTGYHDRGVVVMDQVHRMHALPMLLLLVQGKRAVGSAQLIVPAMSSLFEIIC